MLKNINLSDDLRKDLSISYWMCTRESFCGLKLPGPVTDHPSTCRTIIRMRGALTPVLLNFYGIIINYRIYALINVCWISFNNLFKT